MTKYAIVGNRYEWTQDEVRAKLLTYNIKNTDIIISGEAIGVDTYAKDFAEEMGIEYRPYPPNLNEPIPQRYYTRNKSIAMDCDILIAFDRKKGSSGTKNTIGYAKKLGKQVILNSD